MSRAESGGVTVVSWVVQMETHVGPAGVSSPALSRVRTALFVAELEAGEGALARREIGGQVGQGRPVVR